MKSFDVIVIGAGAAGMMCAATAGYRGRSVLLIDSGKKLGRKILISGGGRCNFTNFHCEPSAYISHNPHFCKSALARYTQHDFIELVDRHGIQYHEKTLGQLFCDDSAKDIVQMLETECEWAGVEFSLRTHVESVTAFENGYRVESDSGEFQCESLVVATGGLSMPKLGASPFGFKLAEQLGLHVYPLSAGLVPFTLHDHDKEKWADLSGISIPAQVTSESGKSFKENILFTHRGLSGPAILQISSYWCPGESVSIHLLPELNKKEWFEQQRKEHPQQMLTTVLSKVLPKRFVEQLQSLELIPNIKLNQFQHKEVDELIELLEAFKIAPNGTEGYRTAEVTLGGVDTNELSSKTMEAKKAPGMYFIGEVVDVTGWLGGYNFQWAWSSGWCAGQYV